MIENARNWMFDGFSHGMENYAISEPLAHLIVFVTLNDPSVRPTVQEVVLTFGSENNRYII
jgi:hypothetical protein